VKRENVIVNQTTKRQVRKQTFVPVAINPKLHAHVPQTKAKMHSKREVKKILVFFLNKKFIRLFFLKNRFRTFRR